MSVLRTYGVILGAVIAIVVTLGVVVYLLALNKTCKDNEQVAEKLLNLGSELPVNILCAGATDSEIDKLKTSASQCGNKVPKIHKLLEECESTWDSSTGTGTSR